ncbi:MAG: polyribonucleotide nucleotidyltransferase [Planctomycetota bacterium]
MKVKVERTIAERTLSIETGVLAKQADAAVKVQYGDSVVLVSAVSEPNERGVPFFPLTVEYREKQYAAGQFPGGIIKREGRPTLKETLTCRLIDRPLRPLFPKGYREEVQVVGWVLSSDGENDPDVLAMIGASAALSLSGMPFQGPIGGCRVGLANDEFVINPTHEEREASELELVVASTRDAVVMMEGSAKVLPEDDMLTAIRCAHDTNQEVIGLIGELTRQVEKEARPQQWEPAFDAQKALPLVKPEFYDRFKEALRIQDKLESQHAVKELRKEAVEKFCDPEDEEAPTEDDLQAAFDEMSSQAMREEVIDNRRRLDGRELDQVRDVWCEVGSLPRTHGSAVFTRGETQALVATTLGTVQDEQRILDPLVEEEPKKFMLHYNFPPFCVGEVRPIRGPRRREKGHGDLAERSLQPVLPLEEEFPYTIRLVSDILESNGSSSMASVCGGTLALMDAGVPISNPVAGIAIGMVKDGDEVYLLSDIAGAEDHHGDMDLKVAGTQHGVTAVQMDLKVKGIGVETLGKAFEQAREARMGIMRTMLRTLERPRESISRFAPRLIQVQIDPDKIGKLIGPGGKTIKGLEEKYECNIEVEDDGSVTVSAPGGEGRAEEAAEYIKGMGKALEVGKVYEGHVTEIKDFGAIVELFPGTDGLCHISQLDESYVEEVRDICEVGDTMKVKVLSVEDNRVRLSRKEALKEEG